MKITGILLFAVIFQLSASTFGQKVNMKVKNASFEDVLLEIKEKSQYDFLYSYELLKNAKPVTFSVQNATLAEVLEKCLQNQPFSYLINKKTITLIAKTETAQQQVNVSGKVTSETGAPLAGVSVRLKGANTGTSTNAEGNYTLNLPNSTGTLSFSFIGYKIKEEDIAGRSTISVSMVPEDNKLNELVVVGYGTQKKVDVTGSVATLKGETLVKAAQPNLMNSLVGRLTGVISTQQSGKPGFDDPKFVIRGKSTFGDNSSLVLVDGIERSFSRMDPNEIESVTILKDAASAAVYGARAANGVILVTTKRGIEGKPTISYTGTFGFQEPARIPSLMNAYDYAKYLNIAKVNLNQAPRFTDEQVEQFRTGALPSTNWWDVTLKKNAPVVQHNVNISGGNKETKYFVDLGVMDQDGLYDLSYFKRYNVRVNLDNQISKSLKVSLDLVGRKEKLSQSALGDALFSTIINSKPTESAYTPDDVAVGGLGSNGQDVSAIGQANQAGYNRTDNNVFQSTLSALYKAPFLEGLSGKISYSYDRFFSTNDVFNTPYSYYRYDRVNNLWTGTKSGGEINLVQAEADSSNETLQASLMYDKTFGNHAFSSLLLFEQADSRGRNLQAYREGFISSSIDQLFAGGDLNKNNNGSASETARRGYVGRVNYSYANKYLVQANFRYDGSFNFPEDKRWGFFPAVSVGWRISEESFLKDNNVISNLKLRASYGQFGNDRVPAYQYLAGFQFAAGGVFGNGYNKGIRDTGIPNLNITWETATNTDIGLEFALLGGKLSGEVDYFYKRTKDILLPRTAAIPQSFGAVLPYENIGIVDNKGFEMTLGYKDQINDFSYGIDGNFTYVKSKVIFQDESINVPAWQKTTGQPFDQYFGYKAMGLFQSQDEINAWADQDGLKNQSLRPGDIKYFDYNGDGKIDGLDINKIGKSDIPELIFGLNLSAGYKGFALSANLQGATGFQQYLRYVPFNLEAGALNMFKDSWTPDNTGAKYPALYAGIKQNNQLSSSYWLYDASYVKLRNLEISYTFGQLKAFEKIGVKGLRIFTSGSNLLTFSKLKDFDPETPNLNPDSGRAYYYPQLRSYYLGVNIKL